MVRVKSVQVLEAFKARLVFREGSIKTIDLAPFLMGPMVEPLKDPARFREDRVDPESGTLVRPNGADKGT